MDAFLFQLLLEEMQGDRHGRPDVRAACPAFAQHRLQVDAHAGGEGLVVELALDGSVVGRRLGEPQLGVGQILGAAGVAGSIQSGTRAAPSGSAETQQRSCK